jgi:hypothetical protein
MSVMSDVCRPITVEIACREGRAHAVPMKKDIDADAEEIGGQAGQKGCSRSFLYTFSVFCREFVNRAVSFVGFGRCVLRPRSRPLLAPPQGQRQVRSSAEPGRCSSGFVHWPRQPCVPLLHGRVQELDSGTESHNHATITPVLEKRGAAHLKSRIDSGVQVCGPLLFQVTVPEFSRKRCGGRSRIAARPTY